MSVSKSDLIGYGVKLFGLLFAGAHVAARLGLVALRVLARYGWGVGLVGLLALGDEERRRAGRHWLLLEGNRWHLVGVLSGGMFFLTFALGIADVIGVRESSFVTTMFSTIIAGLFSFVPIVIAVNSLTMTRLFGTPEGLRDRLDDVQSFREDVESLAETPVSPTDPSAFLTLVLESVRDRSQVLLDEVSGAPEETRHAVGALVRDLDDDIDEVEAEVAEHESTLFAILLPMMDHDYSAYINRVRRLRVDHADDLSADSDEVLATLQELLVSVDVARQYFKSVYLQQELAALSRWLAYSGIGAFLASTFIVMLYASGYPPIVNATPLLLLVAAGIAVSFLPFSILFAYILRIATVVQRTSAPGTFTPQRERPPHKR